jgi:hypothetical protein
MVKVVDVLVISMNYLGIDLQKNHFVDLITAESSF